MTEFKTKQEATSMGFILEGEFHSSALEQYICILRKDHALALCRFGPKTLDGKDQSQSLINRVVLPTGTLKDIVGHIEGCLIQRREHKGLPWDKSWVYNNQTIYVRRVYGLGPLRRNYGYTIGNETNGEIFGVDDILLTKKGFLEFLKSSLERLEERNLF